MNPQSGADKRYRITDLDLHLRYRHGFGAASPFFDALLNGEALASRCPTCDDRRFPPRQLCLKDRTPTELCRLRGRGTLVRFTVGSPNSLLKTADRTLVFGEVEMDGVNNRVFARIQLEEKEPTQGLLVELVPWLGNLRHPIQALAFKPVALSERAG